MYKVTPKEILRGRGLKSFYRQAYGSYMLPSNWRSKPAVVVLDETQLHHLMTLIYKHRAAQGDPFYTIRR